MAEQNNSDGKGTKLGNENDHSYFQSVGASSGDTAMCAELQTQSDVGLFSARYLYGDEISSGGTMEFRTGSGPMLALSYEDHAAYSPFTSATEEWVGDSQDWDTVLPPSTTKGHRILKSLPSQDAAGSTANGQYSMANHSALLSYSAMPNSSAAWSSHSAVVSAAGSHDSCSDMQSPPSSVDERPERLNGKIRIEQEVAVRTHTRGQHKRTMRRTSELRCGKPGCVYKGTFLRDYERQRHINAKHGILRYECADCGKTWNRKDKIVGHCKKEHPQANPSFLTFEVDLAQMEIAGHLTL